MSDFPTDPITIKDASALSGYSVPTLYRYINAGKIRTYRMRPDDYFVYLSIAEVEEWVNRKLDSKPAVFDHEGLARRIVRDAPRLNDAQRSELASLLLTVGR